MENMIILDIETGDFDVESGIMEVAALAIENNEIKDKLHIGIVYDENLIANGYGDGYEEISNNYNCIEEFKKFINKYNYPIVAHNANFDRKFLVNYNWISEDYVMYDSIRAIKYENPYLFSYALDYLLDYYEIDRSQKHTAINDVYDLYNILKIVKPKVWVPVGKRIKKSKPSVKKHESLDEHVEIIGDLFKDKNIVFTGKGPYARKDLSIIAMKYGANILNGVNKKTDILVVGEGAGQKLNKANDLGIEIISIDDFMDMTSDIDIDVDIKSNKNKLQKTSRLKINELYFDEKYLEGLIVSLIPMRLKMAEKLALVINKLGGNPIISFRQKETNLLIYEKYGEDFITVNKAKDKNIKVISLSEFNRCIINKNFDIIGK